MNIAQSLARAGRVYSERLAVFHGERPLYDYRTLASRAAAIAGGLRGEVGLHQDDRVAVFMSNCPSYLELLYGILWAGLVPVPINAKLHAKEVAFILDHAQARALFISADLALALTPLLAEIPSVKRVFVPDDAEYADLLAAEPLSIEHRAGGDLAWLFYTSGTTGRPKGVMLSHRAIYAMAASYFSDVDEISPQDAVVYAAPISHGAGMYGFPHMMRAARHVVPESGGFDPAELHQLSCTVGRLSFFAAPTMVKRLVSHYAHGGQPSGYRTITYGGGPMYLEDIKQALAVMGDRFVQIYGQGESPMTITALSRAHLAHRNHPRWEARIASVGVAQSPVEVRVADPDGVTLPDDETGEVLVRGDTVMNGYWRNPEATEKTIKDGWLWTGDVGAFDADGFLTLKDRSKDVIISGGSNIYPREVEEVLLRHPAVAEVSVVGRTDPEWGEKVVAFVVCRGRRNIDTSELDRLCLDQIARFKRPREYRFIESLPKNNYGKVLKTALKEML